MLMDQLRGKQFTWLFTSSGKFVPTCRCSFLAFTEWTRRNLPGSQCHCRMKKTRKQGRSKTEIFKWYVCTRAGRQLCPDNAMQVSHFSWLSTIFSRYDSSCRTYFRERCFLTILDIRFLRKTITTRGSRSTRAPSKLHRFQTHMSIHFFECILRQ